MELYDSSEDLTGLETSEEKRGFKHFYRHPWLRLAVAYLDVFLCFYLVAEDPISNSHAECQVDILGNSYSFVMTR